MAIIEPPSSGSVATPPDPMDPDLAIDPNPQVLHVPARVVVKFRDDVSLPDDEGPFSQQLEPPHAAVSPDLGQAVLRSGSSPLSAVQLKEMVTRARDLRPGFRVPRLANFRWLAADDRDQAKAFAEELRALPQVETAYVRPPPVRPPQLVQAYDDVLSAKQCYLYAAPDGVDAHYAWSQHGSGRATKLADIEWGWNLAHVDLPGANVNVINPAGQSDLWHGTSVLGVIASVDNDHHCVGIAPHVDSITAICQQASPTDYWTHEAVLAALENLQAGDVMLIEAQTIAYGEELIPLEAEPQVFAYLQLAHALGVVVVEAAGNGGVNLDGVRDFGNTAIFNRKVRDSGAIVVASAEPDSKPRWKRRNNSCYGQRVDCFAQGSGVVTLTSDYAGTLLDQWTNAFADTSAASAIVAGAALALQSVAFDRYGQRLSPTQVRKRMSDDSLNTLSADYGKDLIGVMPNLKTIMDSLPASPP